MSRFTIFTIILSISVITVMADLVIRDYFGAEEGEASVVMYEETGNRKQETEEATEEQAAKGNAVQNSAPLDSSPPTTNYQPPTANYTPPPPSATITLEKIRTAGFTGSFLEKHFAGKLFQLLDITKNPVDAIGFYEISQDVGPIASVTEIALRDEIRALQLYSLLQNKTKPYIDLTLNETNAYGDRSFYINHAKKPNEAFLTVKIGRMIYGFAYVKFYHPEVKRLIQLLSP